MAIQMRRFPDKVISTSAITIFIDVKLFHENLVFFYGETFNDDHPNCAARIEQVNIRIVQLIEIECVKTLFGGNKNVLVTRFWVYPRGRSVDAQRAAIEHF